MNTDKKTTLKWLLDALIFLFKLSGRAITKVATTLVKVVVFIVTPIWRGIAFAATAAVAILLISICINIMAHTGLFGGSAAINVTRGLIQTHETTQFKFRDAQAPKINMIRQLHGNGPLVDMHEKPLRRSAPVIVLELNTMAPDHPSPSEFGTLVDEVFANVAAGYQFSGVVLVLDSPGGSVVEFGAYYAEMMRLRQLGIPITVCVDQVAASGGYMIAMTGDEIIASPFAMIGSVGVVAEMLNYNGALELLRIKDVTITSGDFKRDVTPTSKLTDEKIAHRKAKLVAIHNQFKKEVVRLRKLAGSDVDPDKTLQADTWTAQETMDLKLGLVDGIGTSNGVLNSLNLTADLIYLNANKKQSWSQYMKSAASDIGDHFIDHVSHKVDERLQGRDSLPQAIAQ